MEGLDLVVFDMDGVVFEGRSFWLDLHREYGTVTEALVLAEELTSDYARVARVTAEQLWKGKPAEPFLRLVRERAYQPGIGAVMRVLAARGVATAIVSSGPSQLARRAQRELGFDVVVANEVVLRDELLAVADHALPHGRLQELIPLLEAVGGGHG